MTELEMFSIFYLFCICFIFLSYVAPLVSEVGRSGLIRGFDTCEQHARVNADKWRAMDLNECARVLGAHRRLERVMRSDSVESVGGNLFS